MTDLILFSTGTLQAAFLHRDRFAAIWLPCHVHGFWYIVVHQQVGLALRAIINHLSRLGNSLISKLRWLVVPPCLKHTVPVFLLLGSTLLFENIFSCSEECFFLGMHINVDDKPKKPFLSGRNKGRALSYGIVTAASKGKRAPWGGFLAEWIIGRSSPLCVYFLGQVSSVQNPCWLMIHDHRGCAQY